MPWIIGIILTAFIAICVSLAVISENNFDKECSSMGGHIKTTSSVSPLTGKGGVSINTTRFCLSADGRILDIQ